MLTSNLLSRTLPKIHPNCSIYKELHVQDAIDDCGPDTEAQAGLTIDEENFQFQDTELSSLDLPDDRNSQNCIESSNFFNQSHGLKATDHSKGIEQTGNLKWINQSPRYFVEDGDDDDVPASLLIEEHEMTGPTSTTADPRLRKLQKTFSPKPSLLERENRAQQKVAQAREYSQRLHNEMFRKSSLSRRSFGRVPGNAKEKALWRWINITNLDNFIRDVYEYYTGAGIWCILLERTIKLIQVVFVAVFTTFLTQCVYFQKIPISKNLSEILVPQCTKKISGISNFAIWLFTLHILWRIYLLLADVPRLLRFRDFYLYLLEIPESDMQTISWQDVVARIMALRDANPVTAEEISPSNRRFLGSQSKQRLDAHDIANRLMRRENYLIALFNKDILDLTLPIPFFKGRQLFSRTLLWNIDQCVMDLVFNDKGQVRQAVLKDSHRRQLSNALRRRFMFAGFMNACLAPIIVIYLITMYFLRYFNEYQKNPAAVGSRQYTPLALWKFREFNELQHFFDRRVNMSHPFASRYLDQFPKVKVTQLARILSFFAGSIVSVLAVVTLWDPEMLTSFELTPDRPVVFYIGIFGAIWALTNGMIPEENLVFEPEYALRNVIDYTHYIPDHWRNRLHSNDVKVEFSRLYKLKILIFIEEVFSIIITPFILWFSLPKCSDQITDFFREFTVHVDGVGYVCSFAVFDFKKGNGKKLSDQTPGSEDVRDDYYATKHGKMTASYYGFIDNYLLNPKTAIQGHIPPGTRQKYYPPPPFPGLMSPALMPETQNPRVGYGKKILRSRTTRATSASNHGTSPLQSILLDPEHQPSNSGFRGLNSYFRFKANSNIIEESIENNGKVEPESENEDPVTRPYEGVLGPGESRWQVSPPRTTCYESEEDEDSNKVGVLGMLYQFQKAQKDPGGGVNI
ncbi:Autophagy-related protein 9 [Golovinomyces cichoracearum]|uniref:Autophagy-related protein 9 n=1 Tax=Golovinomyces cichoracearum TaxID=62708 RepID=A0A420HJI1_9PEZI|nr:Autophagy-related protein 9 [Golovinomyces cichoracearum]